MRRHDREITRKTELEEIISRADVCRIALANDNMPYIITMNFGYSGETGTLYFHCASEGRKIEMIKQNNLVCFEMDTDHFISGGERGCDWGMKFSSILGYGKIFIVSGEEEKIKGLNHIMAHYAGDKQYSFDSGILMQTTVLRLEISEITGKRKI